MKRKLAFISLVSFLLFSAMIVLHGENYPLKAVGTAKAVIAVKWYGVGKRALEGLPGVQKVETGWHGTFEVNRVYYDPEKITVEEMVKALKNVKTFIRVIKRR